MTQSAYQLAAFTLATFLFSASLFTKSWPGVFSGAFLLLYNCFLVWKEYERQTDIQRLLNKIDELETQVSIVQTAVGLKGLKRG